MQFYRLLENNAKGLHVLNVYFVVLTDQDKGFARPRHLNGVGNDRNVEFNGFETDLLFVLDQVIVHVLEP